MISEVGDGKEIVFGGVIDRGFTRFRRFRRHQGALTGNPY
jgi:hypothetical protein